MPLGCLLQSLLMTSFGAVETVKKRAKEFSKQPVGLCQRGQCGWDAADTSATNYDTAVDCYCGWIPDLCRLDSVCLRVSNRVSFMCRT